MKDIKKKLAPLFAICYFISMLMFPVCPAEAADKILPTAKDNLSVGLRSTSELVATSDGYMRVFYDGEKINIEYYDNNFDIQSKKSIAMELSIWGGFYAGSNAYYVVEGQNNTTESDTAEVIRVIKYDTNWNKIGTAKVTGNPNLFGGEVRYPFNYGCVEMTEHNGILYIVTGHEGYVDPMYKQGHQGFLMIAVDEASMTGSIVDCDLWHSFAQYIDCKDSNLYVLEQSEGSRFTKLTKYNAEDLKNTSLAVLEYGGDRDSAWAIACYATVDGMALSSDNVLCLGTSIDQSQYDSVSSNTSYNIYLTVTPMSDFSEDATTVKWLTEYSGDGKRFSGTKITKVNDNRFLVSWEEYGTSQTASIDDSLSASILHYVFIDGAGNKISKEFTQAAPISDCQPIVKGSKIVYYASNANMVNFYTIDVETGDFTKKGYRVAGENVTWELNEGVLTISGTGAITFSSGSVWESVRETTEKIIISGGITDIPESAFTNFDNLTEVEIESGVKSIGKKAFYGCNALSKITIPSTVTSIGEDFLWTGYYWTYDYSHVVSATIYAPKDSFAIKYAQENDISYKIIGEDTDNDVDDDVNSGYDDNDTINSGDVNGAKISISKATISGIKESYAYTGKAQQPKVTVKLDSKTLKKDTDYTVLYSDNVNTGKATVKIKGINDYSGTITKTFKIVPKKATISKLKSPKSKTVSVTWKKDSQATGYQIQYAMDSKFKKGKKTIPIAKKSTISKKIPKLTRNKKYYVRIRAYKKIDGQKCYGAWSKTKKVKCK